MDRRQEKKRRRAHRKARQSTHRPAETYEEAIAGLATGLDEPHPIAFLAHTSGLWSTLTAAPADPDRVSPVDFVQSLIDTPARETTALLTLIRVFADDQLLRLRIDRELASRTHRLPGWLTKLDKVTLDRVVRQTEPFKDGDQYWFELGWPDGTALTLGVLTDANWSLALKDVLTVPDRVSVVEAIMAEHPDGTAGITFEPIAPADARAEVTEAIARGDMMYPPHETDSWPQARPLLEWILRMLPEGGQGFPEYDLDETATDEIVDRFVASPQAKGLVKTAGRTVGSLIWYAGYSDGDPLRWSPVKIEVLLTDWWHRKVMQSPADDRRLPKILRAFVSWCGQEKGLPADLVAVNLAAIDTWEPAFLAAIDGPRSGIAAEMARIAAGVPLDEVDLFDDFPLDDDLEPDEEADAEGAIMGAVAALVGGWEALAKLNAEPLPDENLSLDGVPADIVDDVRAAAEAVDADIKARALPETDELRTAARRLVHRIAVGDPAAWRRKASPASTACAIAYLLYDANHLLKGRVRVKDLAASFGLKVAPPSRINTFRKAAFGLFEGDASVMTSGARETLIDTLADFGA